jgi:CheY-like chemotaxis protein
MVTANVFDEDVRRYLAAGADGVLKKPIDLNELYGVISQVSAAVLQAGAAPSDQVQRQA